MMNRHSEKIVLDRVELPKIDIKYGHKVVKNFINVNNRAAQYKGTRQVLHFTHTAALLKCRLSQTDWKRTSNRELKSPFTE